MTFKEKSLDIGRLVFPPAAWIPVARTSPSGLTINLSMMASFRSNPGPSLWTRTTPPTLTVDSNFTNVMSYTKTSQVVFLKDLKIF